MPRSCRATSLFILVVATGTTLAQQEAQRPPTRSANELRRDISKVEQEIAALIRSPEAPPAWQELQKLEGQLTAMKELRQREQEPLNKRVSELRGTGPVAEWESRIEKLHKQANELRQEDFRQAKEAGRRLFQERHAALAKTSPTQTPQLRALGLSVLDYPRVDGSTSTQPLAALIACRCFGAPYAWEGREQKLPRTSRFDHSLPVSDLDLFLDSQYSNGEPELVLLEFWLRAKGTTLAQQRLALIINGLLAANSSTHQAYVNLIEGQSELGLLARPPSEDELDLARMRGVALDVRPCALDAFVFLVNERNAVGNVTLGQIRNIYAGQIRNWREVGGAVKPVTAYQREENSGSQELMKSLVMKELPLAKPSGEFQYPPQLIGRLMSSTFLQLTQNEDGIGYSVYYYEQFMSGSQRTRTIAVDGVEPNFENIRARKYPLVSEVLVVTRRGIEASSPAGRLRDWLLSREGQAVVRESGYVPLAQGQER